MAEDGQHAEQTFAISVSSVQLLGPSSNVRAYRRVSASTWNHRNISTWHDQAHIARFSITATTGAVEVDESLTLVELGVVVTSDANDVCC